MVCRIVLSLSLFALALVSVAVLYLNGHAFQGFQFNSDAMYLPTLFADLFERGGRLRDWYLTPAPYFFPDYLLYALAFVSVKGAFYQILLFSLLQVIAAAIAAAAVFRSCVRHDAAIATALIGTAVTWLALRPFEPMVYALVSAHHFGSLVAALIFVALWLHRDNGARGCKWLLAGMCALAYSSALSDNLFLVQAIGPFVLACALVRRVDTRISLGATWPAAAVCLSAVLGAASYRWAVGHPTRVPTHLGLRKLADNAHDLVVLFVSASRQSPLMSILIVTCLVLGVVCCIRVALTRQFLELPRPMLLLIVFSTFMTAANLCALLFATNLVIVPRYLIALFVWPLVLATILLAHWSGRRFATLGSSACALFVLSTAIGAIQMPALALPAYPEQIACIDRALKLGNARHGIAQYWDAKRIQAFSRHTLTIAQYGKNMSEHRWITSAGYFQPSYDFAILTDADGPEYSLPLEQIVASSGLPLQVTTCGDRKVLVYGHNKLRLQKFVEPGDTHVWKGCQLPSQIGKATPECAMSKQTAGAEGYLTFGPYELLGAGEYRFDLAYSSIEPLGSIAGKWDVAVTIKNASIQLEGGNLAGTAGKDDVIHGRFIVNRLQSGGLVEVRTMAPHGGQFQVDWLRITRVR